MPRIIRTNAPGSGTIVAALETSETVAPTGAWDFAQAPTVDGQPIGGGGTVAVSSVNGETGVVVLDAADVGAQPAGDYATAAALTAASTDDRARANHTGTQAISTVTGLQAALDAKATATIAGNTQTGTAYTLVLSDAGRAVEMNNATANTLTIPPNSLVALPVGTVVEVLQLGAGQTTVAAGSGVTLRAPDGAKLARQYASASLRKRADDEWVLAGNTVA
jgi:hypothetical protein